MRYKAFTSDEQVLEDFWDLAQKVFPTKTYQLPVSVDVVMMMNDSAKVCGTVTELKVLYFLLAATV